MRPRAASDAGGRPMSLGPRLIASEKRGEDVETSLRPQTLDEFVGQAAARANLKVFIEAAKRRGEALDHVLFVGPPGLGKTTLAQIMARELGVNFRSTSGPVIAKAGDLAALLTNLEDRDVLFIDEIHRLNPAVEEILYPAMEDYQLDLIIGEGPAARSVKIDLAKFTLVAATTRLGLLTTPLRDRFGIPDPAQLLYRRRAGADRAPRRPHPRPAAHRRRRRGDRAARARHAAHRRAAAAAGARLRRRRRRDEVTRTIADEALSRLEVDALGLDQLDRRYLTMIAENFGGGPVGIETIAAALSEPRDAIEDIIEPYLIQQGFIQRTPRGRMLTGNAWSISALIRHATSPCSRSACFRTVTDHGRGAEVGAERKFRWRPTKAVRRIGSPAGCRASSPPPAIG